MGSSERAEWVRHWSDGDLDEENGSVMRYANAGVDTVHLHYEHHPRKDGA